MNKNNPEKLSKYKFNNDYSQKIKILIIGDTGVGKTALITKYIDDKFEQSYVSTIGIDFKEKIVDLQSKKIRLQVWDTAGQQRFHTITQAYYRGAEGLIITFSLARLETFQHLQYWLQHIQQGAPEQCLKILVGTKADLLDQRKVCKDKIVALTERIGFRYLQVSSKTGDNVDNCFCLITELILNQKKNRPTKQLQRYTLTSEYQQEKVNRKRSCKC